MIFQRNHWHYDIAINLNLWEATQRHELLQYNFYIQRSTSTGDVIYQRWGGYASQAVEMSLVFSWGDDCAAMQYERTGIFHWPPCGVGIAAGPTLKIWLITVNFSEIQPLKLEAHPFIHRHVQLSLPLHLFAIFRLFFDAWFALVLSFIPSHSLLSAAAAAAAADADGRSDGQLEHGEQASGNPQEWRWPRKRFFNMRRGWVSRASRRSWGICQCEHWSLHAWSRLWFHVSC